MKDILEKADSLYWSGQPTGLSDKDFDTMAQKISYISKPQGNMWAKFPDCKLLIQNNGLKKVPYEIASKAVKWWPKWDGIYTEIYSKGREFYCVTRGNGKTGKNLAPYLINLSGLINLFSRIVFEYMTSYKDGLSSVTPCELVYSVADGGREALVRDLSRNDHRSLKSKLMAIPHCDMCFNSQPDREIYNFNYEDDIEYPCDGVVIELADGQKFAYKGEA